jgi:hypothetical protein
MALTGLSMDVVLSIAVGEWPFEAGIGLGWYSAVSVVEGVDVDVRAVRRNSEKGSQRPACGVSSI